ncbi:MAG: hypothetical protein ACOZCL_07325 [Bacillota bacterium]
MEKKKLRIAKIISTAIILCTILGIVLMHSYFNLQYELQGPSENWGRDITIKEMVVNKKAPSFFLTDNSADMLIIDGNKMENVIIDRSTAGMTTSPVNIPGAVPENVTQLNWNKDFVVWMENFDLFYSRLNSDGTYSEKQLIKEAVKQFQVIKNSEAYLLLVAGNNEIVMYEILGDSVKQAGAAYPVQNLRGASAVCSKDGKVHIAALASDNDILYPIKYITYESTNWTLITEKVERYLSRAWKISDIEIGIDDEDVYIFYQLGKWDTHGMSVKLLYTSTPIGGIGNEMVFDNLNVLPEDKGRGSAIIFEPVCVKVQGEKLKAAVIRDSIDYKGNDGLAVFLMTFEDGNVETAVKAVKEKSWPSNMAIDAIGDDIGIAFLDTAGKGNSEILYAESSKSFIKAASSGRPIDYLYAILNAIPSYITGTLIGLVRALVFLPAVFWIIFVEVFEIRGLRRRPDIVVGVAIVIHAVTKLFTMGNYYTKSAIKLMPDILKFSHAQYFYGVLILGMSLLITALVKNSRKDMHHMVEYLVFAASDIIITTLLYTAYFL